jgi:hypothetical protein
MRENSNRKLLPKDDLELRLLFLLRPSWIERSAEKIVYSGDSRWSHTVDLYLNWDEIKERLSAIPTPLGAQEGTEAAFELNHDTFQDESQIIDSSDGRCLIIPLCTLPKNQLLSSFSAKDATGTSLFVFQRSTSAEYIVFMINSLLAPYGIETSARATELFIYAFSAIAIKDDLKRSIMSDMGEIAKRIYDSETDRGVFSRIRTVDILVWLTETFLHNWLPLASIREDQAHSAIISFTYSQTWQIAENNGKKTLFLGKQLCFPLSMLGNAESEHITIEAPPFTRFLPCAPTRKEKRAFKIKVKNLYQQQKATLEAFDETNSIKNPGEFSPDMFVSCGSTSLQ